MKQNGDREIFKAFENKNFLTRKLNSRNEEGGICFYHEFINLCCLVDDETVMLKLLHNFTHIIC